MKTFFGLVKNSENVHVFRLNSFLKHSAFCVVIWAFLPSFFSQNAFSQPQVFLDQRKYVFAQPNGSIFRVQPKITYSSASDFYDYYSASSHMGIETLDTGFIFIHQDASMSNLPIGLILTAGIDESTTGLMQRDIVFNVVLNNLPDNTLVVQANDNATEFSKTGNNSAEGDWRCDRNSDGFAMSQFPIDRRWFFTGEINVEEGIDNFYYYQNDGLVSPHIEVGAEFVLLYTPSNAGVNYDISAYPGELVEVCGSIVSPSEDTSYVWRWGVNGSERIRNGTAQPLVQQVCDEYEFSTPGTYQVTLEASDSSTTSSSTILVKVSQKCGNGIIDVNLSETCDDGNTNSGDGCSDSCSDEIGYSCDMNHDLIQNGSFETPTVTEMVSGAPVGWTGVSGTSVIHNQTYSPDGQQHLELTEAEFKSVYQDIPTRVGQRYTLEFQGAYNAECGDIGAIALVEAADTSNPNEPHTSLLLNEIADRSSDPWVEHLFEFTAVSDMTRLSFSGILPGNGCGYVIDRVRLLNSECTPIDDDRDGILTRDEDLDNDGNPTNDDTDVDGTPNYLDPDDDGDGIPTFDEDLDGNGDPTNDDADGDGIADYLDADALDGPLADLDGDGLSNQEESTLGLDPQRVDTDGDGICDGPDAVDGCQRAGPDPKNGDMCVPGRVCDASVGQACRFDDSCASGMCVDGVCFVPETEQPEPEFKLVLDATGDQVSTDKLDYILSGTTLEVASLMVLLDGVEQASVMAPRTSEDFEFELLLRPGENTIEVIADAGDKDLSESLTIIARVSPLQIGGQTVDPNSTTEIEEGSILSGTANPGEQITVKFNGQQICQTTADENGEWSCQVNGVQGEGLVTIENADGDVIGSLQANVFPGAPAPRERPEQSGGCVQAQGENNRKPGIFLWLIVGFLGLGRFRFEGSQ